jgi:hypothetical protein
MTNQVAASRVGQYESPHIADYGDLMEITQACFGTGGEDGGSKANGNPFVNSAPYFGDSQDFCAGNS